MTKCAYHDCTHSPKMLDDFTKQCQRLGIVVGNDCPIKLVMETSTSKVAVLEPTYKVFNADATGVTWPHNIDLFITKFPSTEKDGFTKGLAGFIANRAFTFMNANSLAYVIVSSLKEEKMRPFALVDIFVSAGFKFLDTIVFIKNKFIPTQGSKRLNNIYDFIFCFAKGDNYHLDRQSVAYLKNNVNPDDQEPASDEYRCPGNAWRIKIDDKDVTPVELIECIIKLSNVLPNSMICDPFASNTTLEAAIKMGHSFWGCVADKTEFKRCKGLLK